MPACVGSPPKRRTSMRRERPRSGSFGMGIGQAMLAQGEVLRRDASLLTELADGLPAVSADRVQLQQLLLNLMMNALDAMSAVTDRPRVLRIRTSTCESAAILVALRDSGVGLNPEQMERLFEAFYTTKPEGMGMGLSISRSIVE